MKFFWPFSRKNYPNTEKKSAGFGSYGDAFLDRVFLSQYGYVSPVTALEMSRSSSALGTAVSMIAEDAMKIAPVLRLPDGKITDDAEVLQFLKRPNNIETPTGFREALFRHYLLTHECPVMAEGRPERPPIMVWSVKPQYLSVIENQRDKYAQSISVSDGIAEGRYLRHETRPTEMFRYLDPSGLRELFRVMGFSSRNNNARPDSPVEAIFKEISVQINLMVSNNATLINGSRPSALMAFKDNPGDEELSERRRHVNEQIGGAENAGKTLVTRADGFDFTQLSLSNKDMDFRALYEVVRNVIYNFYNIPLQMIATDASTFSNMAEARELYYIRAVIPTYQKVMGDIGAWLLPKFGLDPQTHAISFNEDDIEALQSKRLRELGMRRELNLETINELRDTLPNREPMEGGDVLYQSSLLVPVTTDIFTDDNIDTEEEARRIIEASPDVETPDIEDEEDPDDV